MEGRVMGIYIKGFKPQDGLYVIKDGVIRKYKGNGGTVRPYELVEVKEPHGRLIDADEIVKDLRHDVAVDQDMLDYEELTDVIRETTQADKDIKQNAAEIIESLPTVQFEERTEERTETHACDLIKRQDAIDGTVIITVDDYTKVNRIIVKDESHFGCVFEPVDYDEEVGGTMTREEAIEWLIQIQDKYIHDGDEQFDTKRKEALGMAIKALKSDRPNDKWTDGEGRK